MSQTTGTEHTGHMDPDGVKHRFIIGMPRAGTKALMRALNDDPLVCSFGESLFWGRAWVQPSETGELDAEQLEQIALRVQANRVQPEGGPGSLSDDGMALASVAAAAVRSCNPGMNPGEVFERLAGSIASEVGRTYWVEKTPHHLQHLDRMFHYMPNARMLVMIREPSGFLSSYKHQGDRKSPETRKLFHRLYHPALASVVGRKTYRTAKSAIERWPDQLLLVRLEELSKNATELIPRIRAHLGLPQDGPIEYRKDNSSFSGRKKPTDDLSAVEITWLRLIMGKDATALGFQLPARRFSPLGMTLSVLGLIPWTFRNLRRLAKEDDDGIRGVLRRWLG